MNYGLPYMGSKSGIVEKFFPLFPKADNFYDLFSGGCAVTHYALLSKKYKNVFANDLNPMCSLFIDAVHGKFHNENRWISREEFLAKKDTDSYIAFIWSFGNNLKDYLYSGQNEKIKKALWYAVVFNDYSLAEELNIPFKRSNHTDIKKRRLDIMRHWKLYGIKEIDKRMELQSLERLERLQSLESSERLQSLERLEFTNKSYNDIEIRGNSVIYCDIPYKGTAKYKTDFDYEKFFDWACEQQNPIFISEYNIDDDRFECVFEMKKRGILSSTANNPVIERIYKPKKQKINLKGVQMNLF
jgi:site-specific DNA-adenine methylase